MPLFVIHANNGWQRVLIQIQRIQLLHGILLRDLARDFLGDRLRQEAVQRFGGQVDFQQLPKEIFEDQAKRRVKTGLLFQEVVKKNDLKADPAKVDEKIQEIASTYEQPEEVVAHFNSNPDQKAQVESSVLEDAVVDFVLGAAKVKEKKMKYEEAVQAGQPQR